jgi:A/G-specific adenine glycosylase
VLVSELMLQQTQVDRVVPRFLEFVGRFPDLESLAAASEDEVLARWSGLGYYRRARLLHRLAREVIADGGELPRTATELQSLPGVGPYTAAAVASLAYGEAVAVLDGNVMRVASRVLAFDGDPRSAEGGRVLGDWVESLLVGTDPGEINESLMELGATLCSPSSPRCESCPLRSGCAARLRGEQQRFPRPRRRRATEELRWAAACCIDSDGRWLLRRIDDGPILQGLWLPPLATLDLGEDASSSLRGCLGLPASVPAVELPTLTHSITHRRIRVNPVRFEVPSALVEGIDGRWVDPRKPRLPTSSLLGKLRKIINLESSSQDE